MKALLIDAKQETITQIDIPSDVDDMDGHIAKIYEALGCSLFEIVRIEIAGKPVSVFVDEEGLLKEPERFFLLRGYQAPLAGNGLVLGDATADGYVLECPVGIIDVSKECAFAKRGMVL